MTLDGYVVVSCPVVCGENFADLSCCALGSSCCVPKGILLARKPDMREQISCCRIRA